MKNKLNTKHNVNPQSHRQTVNIQDYNALKLHNLVTSIIANRKSQLPTSAVRGSTTDNEYGRWVIYTIFDSNKSVHLSPYLGAGRGLSWEYFTFPLIILCTIVNGTCNKLMKDFQGQGTFSAKSRTDLGNPGYSAYLPSVNPQPLHHHCFLEHTLLTHNSRIPRLFLEPAPSSLLCLLLLGIDLPGPTVSV